MIGVALLAATLWETRQAAKAALDMAEEARKTTIAANQAIIEAKKANEITNRTAFLDQRPWLAVSLVLGSNFRYGVDQKSLHIEAVVRITNLGKTPAIDVHSLPHLTIEDKGTILSKLYLQSESMQTTMTHAGEVIFPGNYTERRWVVALWVDEIKVNKTFIDHKCILPTIMLTVVYKAMDRQNVFRTGVLYDVSRSGPGGIAMVITPEEYEIPHVPVAVHASGVGFVH